MDGDAGGAGASPIHDVTPRWHSGADSSLAACERHIGQVLIGDAHTLGLVFISLELSFSVNSYTGKYPAQEKLASNDQ